MATGLSDYELIVRECCNWNFQLSDDINRLEVLQWLHERIGEADGPAGALSALLEWKDSPGRTDIFDDDGYCDLCRQVWELAGGLDSGCSAATQDNYEFVSRMARLLSVQNQQARREGLEATIARLTEQRDAAEAKLAQLLKE